MPCFVRTPRQQSLHDDNIFFFSKSEVHSQCSSISLFLIITKNIRMIHNTFTVSLKSDNFSDFIEKKKKKILLERHFPCKISIF